VEDQGLFCKNNIHSRVPEWIRQRGKIRNTLSDLENAFLAETERNTISIRENVFWAEAALVYAFSCRKRTHGSTFPLIDVVVAGPGSWVAYRWGPLSTLSPPSFLLLPPALERDRGEACRLDGKSRRLRPSPTELGTPACSGRSGAPDGVGHGHRGAPRRGRFRGRRTAATGGYGARGQRP
jgi:hypothetical protein